MTRTEVEEQTALELGGDRGVPKRLHASIRPRTSERLKEIVVEAGTSISATNIVRKELNSSRTTAVNSSSIWGEKNLPCSIRFTDVRLGYPYCGSPITNPRDESIRFDVDQSQVVETKYAQASGCSLQNQ